MNPISEVIIYEGDDIRVEVRLERENVWLSLQQLADLFGRDKSVISRHLKNIFVTRELERDSVVAKNATTAADGKTYLIDYYSLDAVISVGYRVNSSRATRFRQWATRVLREHLTQGYSLDSSRFEKNAAELEAALPSRPFWAIWNSRRSASRPTRALRARRHTCCISSSRTIPSPTATSAALPFCS